MKTLKFLFIFFIAVAATNKHNFNYTIENQNGIYTLRNQLNHKVKIDFSYNMTLGQGVMLSKELNPSEILKFDVNRPVGLITTAIVTGGKWNGQFTRLIMGSCNTCYRAGIYDIQ